MFETGKNGCFQKSNKVFIQLKEKSTWVIHSIYCTTIISRKNTESCLKCFKGLLNFNRSSTYLGDAIRGQVNHENLDNKYETWYFFVLCCIAASLDPPAFYSQVQLISLGEIIYGAILNLLFSPCMLPMQNIFQQVKSHIKYL